MLNTCNPCEYSQKIDHIIICQLVKSLKTIIFPYFCYNIQTRIIITHTHAQTHNAAYLGPASSHRPIAPQQVRLALSVFDAVDGSGRAFVVVVGVMVTQSVHVMQGPERTHRGVGLVKVAADQ